MKERRLIHLPPARKEVARDLITVLRGFSNHMHEQMSFPPFKGQKAKAQRLLDLNLWRADLEKLLAKGSK